MTFPADHRAPTIHTLFCGFGPASRYAAARLLRAGQPASSIRILDSTPDACNSAARLGLATRTWQSGGLAELERNLRASPTRIIVELIDESELEPVVRLARRDCPKAEILAVVRNRERAEAVLASGASSIVNVSAIAGAMLASSAVGAETPSGDQIH